MVGTRNELTEDLNVCCSPRLYLSMYLDKWLRSAAQYTYLPEYLLVLQYIQSENEFRKINVQLCLSISEDLAVTKSNPQHHINCMLQWFPEGYNEYYILNDVKQTLDRTIMMSVERRSLYVV